jgi:hypothetical protein
LYFLLLKRDLKGGMKMSVNFDKHSVEKRHNQRFLGIFLMFAVVAVVVGIFSAISIANISGYGVLDTFKATNVAAFSGGSGGGSGSPGNGTSVTYQGVLNMFNHGCIVNFETNMSKTCNDNCAINNIGTCVAGYIVNADLTHEDRPVPCGYPIFRANQKLWCTCCSVTR